MWDYFYKYNNSNNNKTTIVQEANFLNNSVSCFLFFFFVSACFNIIIKKNSMRLRKMSHVKYKQIWNCLWKNTKAKLTLKYLQCLSHYTFIDWINMKISPHIWISTNLIKSFLHVCVKKLRFFYFEDIKCLVIFQY